MYDKREKHMLRENGVKEALSDVKLKEQFEQLTKAVKENANPQSEEE